MAKSMLFDSKLPEMFWSPAVKTACYLRNQLPIAINGKTPFELFHRKKPDISNLKVVWMLAQSLIQTL
jgi:hypothetical protein